MLISPLPPLTEEKEEEEVKQEAVVKTQKKIVQKKVEKKVVKVEVKGIDNRFVLSLLFFTFASQIDSRYLTSGGKIFFKECPLYHKAHPWVMPLGLS